MSDDEEKIEKYRERGLSELLIKISISSQTDPNVILRNKKRFEKLLT